MKSLIILAALAATSPNQPSQPPQGLRQEREAIERLNNTCSMPDGVYGLVDDPIIVARPKMRGGCITRREP